MVGVNDVVKKKRFAGNRSSGGATVFCSMIRQKSSTESFPSYIEQRSYDGPHHVTEETVGSDGKYLSFAFGFPAGECHSAIIGFNIGMQFAKTGEIGISVELFGRCIHFVEVEISPITAGEGFDKW